MISKKRTLIALFSLLALTVLFRASLLGAELFSYRPYSRAHRYNLTIKTHAVVDTGSARRYGKLFRDHEDIMTFSQRVAETEDGLLDIASTVEKINRKGSWCRYP
ncbi:hypothetical protein MYX82_10355 [Acidobacteria bacterium AH-259-D05]|nr:hypothetical protein [Acidobacteria bacterium AH-259-D05]